MEKVSFWLAFELLILELEVGFGLELLAWLEWL